MRHSDSNNRKPKHNNYGRQGNKPIAAPQKKSQTANTRSTTTPRTNNSAHNIALMWQSNHGSPKCGINTNGNTPDKNTKSPTHTNNSTDTVTDTDRVKDPQDSAPNDNWDNMTTPAWHKLHTIGDT